MAEIFRSVGKNHKVDFKNFHFFPHSKTLLILPLSNLDIKLHDKSLDSIFFVRVRYFLLSDNCARVEI